MINGDGGAPVSRRRSSGVKTAEIPCQKRRGSGVDLFPELLYDKFTNTNTNNNPNKTVLPTRSALNMSRRPGSHEPAGTGTISADGFGRRVNRLAENDHHQFVDRSRQVRDSMRGNVHPALVAHPSVASVFLQVGNQNAKTEIAC